MEQSLLREKPESKFLVYWKMLNVRLKTNEEKQNVESLQKTVEKIKFFEPLNIIYINYKYPTVKSLCVKNQTEPQNKN